MLYSTSLYCLLVDAVVVEDVLACRDTAVQVAFGVRADVYLDIVLVLDVPACSCTTPGGCHIPLW